MELLNMTSHGVCVIFFTRQDYFTFYVETEERRQGKQINKATISFDA